MTDWHEKTLELIDKSGINGRVAAEKMNIGYANYGNKKSKAADDNFFREKHYRGLADFLESLP